VTQYGAVTAGEYGCHPPSVFAQVGTPYGVNTGMDCVKSASSQSMFDGLAAVPQAEELLSRDDSVLSLRKRPSAS
jgi:hypothetical protein